MLCKFVLLDQICSFGQFGPMFLTKDCILHHCLCVRVEILSEGVLKPLVFSHCWSLLAVLLVIY